jgi:hypothetical protein
MLILKRMKDCPRARAARATMMVSCLAVALGGCLGEPDIDKRWTMVEFLAETPSPGDALPGGQAASVSVKGRITYRRILTGFVIAEVRYSPTLSATSVNLNPTEHDARNAESVDLILANSVTAGRATRIVTGFDHLMQEVDLSFTAQVPDSLYGGGLFLLLYMGEGEEIELPGGGDSLVVTPFVSSDQEILHTGFPLTIAP